MLIVIVTVTVRVPVPPPTSADNDSDHVRVMPVTDSESAAGPTDQVTCPPGLSRDDPQGGPLTRTSTVTGIMMIAGPGHWQALRAAARQRQSRRRAPGPGRARELPDPAQRPRPRRGLGTSSATGRPRPDSDSACQCVTVTVSVARLRVAASPSRLSGCTSARQRLGRGRPSGPSPTRALDSPPSRSRPGVRLGVRRASSPAAASCTVTVTVRPAGAATGSLNSLSSSAACQCLLEYLSAAGPYLHQAA